VITMGAGNITNVGRSLLAKLEREGVKHGA